LDRCRRVLREDSVVGCFSVLFSPLSSLLSSRAFMSFCVELRCCCCVFLPPRRCRPERVWLDFEVDPNSLLPVRIGWSEVANEGTKAGASARSLTVPFSSGISARKPLLVFQHVDWLMRWMRFVWDGKCALLVTSTVLVPGMQVVSRIGLYSDRVRKADLFRFTRVNDHELAVKTTIEYDDVSLANLLWCFSASFCEPGGL
jgi:hypothetical protein